jgi:hypothetical protein
MLHRAFFFSSFVFFVCFVVKFFSFIAHFLAGVAINEVSEVVIVFF